MMSRMSPRITRFVVALLFVSAIPLVMRCSDKQNPFYVPAELMPPDTVVVYTGHPIDTVTFELTKNVETDSFVIEPPLPAGLVLDQTNGLIYGTPEGPSECSVHLVRADNQWGTGEEAELTVMVCPPDPRWANVLAYGADSVVLHWHAIPNVDTFLIWRAIDDQLDTLLHAQTTDTFYVDTIGLLPDHVYFYRLTASGTETPQSLPSEMQTRALTEGTPPDTIAPLVEIVSHGDTTYTDSSPDTVEYRIDGRAGTLIVALDSGWNTVVIDSTDPSGNRGADTAWILYDTVAPVVTIRSPSTDTSANTQDISLIYTIDDSTCTLSHELTMPGDNQVIVEGRDRAGNSGADTIHVYFDTEAPVVTITAPVEDTVYTNASPDTVAYTIDGNGRMLAVSLDSGWNTVVVDTTDESGNRGADTVWVYYDTLAPVVTIESPSADTAVSVRDIDIVYTVDDSACTLSYELAAAGDNVVVVEAVDRAGNRGADSVHVFFDTDAPVVSITSPQEGALIGDSTVEVTYKVDGVSLSRVVSLREGANTIVIDTTDAAGNTGSDTIRVRADWTPPQPPTVLGQSPTNDSTPTWQWNSAGGGIGVYRVKLNDGDLTTGAETVQSDSYTPALPLASGIHNLYVQERDSAGNWSSSGSFAITVDLDAPNAPVVTVSCPPNQTRPTWQWGSGGGGGSGTYRYKLDDNNLSVGAGESQQTSFTPQSSLGESPHTLYVQERDEVGNWSPIASATAVVRLNVLHVDSSVNGGAGDGSSWANAFSTIDSAIAHADASTEVWVARGTYYTEGITVKGILRGGFDGTEHSPVPNSPLALSVLSGDAGVKGDYTDNADTLLVADGELVEGFVLVSSRRMGLQLVSGTVRRCVIRNHCEGEFDGVEIQEETVLDRCVVIGETISKTAGTPSATPATITNSLLLAATLNPCGDSLRVVNSHLWRTSLNPSYCSAEIVSSVVFGLYGLVQGSGQVDFTHCCIDDSSYEEAVSLGSLNSASFVADPGFVEDISSWRAAYTYPDAVWYTTDSPVYLVPDSPCIGAGLYPGNPGTDIRGVPRPSTDAEQAGNPVDIGAYER